MCHITGAARCRLFTESAESGYCAAKDEKSDGFHDHLVINSQGVISGFTLSQEFLRLLTRFRRLIELDSTLKKFGLETIGI